MPLNEDGTLAYVTDIEILGESLVALSQSNFTGTVSIAVHEWYVVFLNARIPELESWFTSPGTNGYFSNMRSLPFDCTNGLYGDDCSCPVQKR